MKMKNIPVIAAILLLCTGLGAQIDQPPVRQLEGDIVVVRIIDRTGVINARSRIIISDGDSRPQSILLKRWSNLDLEESSVENIARVFNEISRQGYQLTAPSGYYQNEGSSRYIDYMFIKRDNRE